MKLRYRFLLLIPMFFVAAAAQAATEHHAALVQKYIRLSGLEKTINGLPAMIASMSQQKRLTSQDPDIDKKVAEAMVKGFDSKKVLAELQQYLLAHTDEYYLVDVLSWMETPLATKIQREEQQSEDPSKSAEVLRYIAKLQENPPPQERIALVQDLVATTHMVELASSIAVRLIRGTLENVNKMLPNVQQVPQEQIEARLRQVRSMLEGSLRQQMTLSSYYTYRNISDEELRQYIAFYKGETGKREIEITGGALVYVLGNWFSEVGQRLVPPTTVKAPVSQSI